MPFDFGNRIKCTVFGSSHSDEIGVTVRGLPHDFTPDLDEVTAFMKRRAPSNTIYSTKRTEDDVPEVTFFDNEIKAIIKNKDVRPQDYQTALPRPGHADYTQFVKYGRIESGGGIFSGRMTAPLCFAGGVCKQLLENNGIKIYARIVRLGGIADDSIPNEDGYSTIYEKELPVFSDDALKMMMQALKCAADEGDSLGAVIECSVFGMPAGIGDAMNEGLESVISKDIFGIPAIKGIEFGSGFSGSDKKGSENNDPFILENENIITKTNYCGGILGGISTGMPVTFRCAVKPTPSIFKEQHTVDLSTKENAMITVSGRHDVCCAVRAVPVIEAVTAIALAGLVCNNNIQSVRSEIDTVDDELAALLIKRKELVEEIGRLKSDFSLPIRDEKRENEIVGRLTASLSESNKSYVGDIMTAVFAASRKAEGEKQ